MNISDVTSWGDSYQWEQQGIKLPDGRRISRVKAAALLDGVGSTDFPLYVYSPFSTAVANEYPKRLLTIPTTGIVISASIRLPESKSEGQSTIWGRHIPAATTIQSSSNNELALCWKTATAANLNSSVKIAAVGGVLAKGGSVRVNTTAVVPNILGAATTSDGVVSLKNLIPSATPANITVSTIVVKLSTMTDALILVDLAVQFTDVPVTYEGFPGIGRRDIFVGR